ncbi:MAG TPA: carboxypeptidase-like regulatory domain-containing protein [Planctomycetota bacterium]|nr:carboxypeptidase-like regulatory domain-containing protein [Planctomycetota bacterium]
MALDGDTGSPLQSFVVRMEVPQANRGWLDRLLGSGGPRERTFRSEEGVFEILDLRPDLYKVRFKAEGYFPVTLEDVPVRKGTLRRGLRLSLRRVATLEGTVVEEGSGTVVPATTMQVLVNAGGSIVEDVEGNWQTVTDLDGRFRIATRAGAMFLRASRDGFVEWIGDPIDLGPGETRRGIVVTLRRGGGIEGTVPGPAHDAGPGPWLSIWREDEEAPRSTGVQADASGHFRVLGLAAGRYGIRAYPRDPSGPVPPRRRLRASVAVEEGRVTRVELAEASVDGCLVRGRVLRRREPVAGAQVGLILVPSTPRAGRAALDPLDQYELSSGRPTGKDGSFAFEGVPPGNATLRVGLFPPGKTGGPLYGKLFPLLVPDGPEFAFDAVLPQGEITGRVYRASDGSPVSGVTVSAFQIEPAEAYGFSELGFCETDAVGRYRVVDLWGGEYYVRVDAHSPGRNRDPFEDPPASLVAGPTAVDGSTVSLDLALPEGGSAVVRVFGPSGRPVPDASVRLRHASCPAESVWNFNEWAEAEPGEEGVYRADGLRPGLYSATIAARGHALAFAEGWQVVEGEEVVFDVGVLQGTRVLVKGADEAGSPVDLIVVDVADSRGRPYRCFRSVSGMTRPGEKGGVVVYLAPGEYMLTGGIGRSRGKATPVRVGGEAEQEVVLRIESGREGK